MRDDICSFAGCRKPAAVIYLLGGKLRPLCDEHFQHVNAVLEKGPLPASSLDLAVEEDGEGRIVRVHLKGRGGEAEE